MNQNPTHPTASEPKPAELSIIIVNWNSANYVRQCLGSLERHPPSCSYEVLVVDSGSFDSCGEMLAREFPRVRFIQSQTNIGFARANNLGFRHSQGRVLLFLNPDTEVIGSALDELRRALEPNANAGIVGARLLNTDGSLQTSCIQSFPTVLNQMLDAEPLRRLFPKSRLWGMAALYQPNSAPRPVEVISGACMMMPRSTFDRVTGFDERFFMYSEDLDLCRRVRASGFQCLYAPEAQVVHHGGGSSNSARSMFSVIMMRESVSRLLTIHRGRFAAFCYRVTSGVSAIVRLPVIVAVNALKAITGHPCSPASRRKWFAILRWSIGLESWGKMSSGEGVKLSSTTDTVSGKERKPSCVA